MKNGRVLDQSDPKGFWAVNIRAQGICLARLRADSLGNFALRDFFWQRYLPGATKKETRVAQATALKEVLERAGVVERNVVFSIPGSYVFTRVRTQELKNLGQIREIAQHMIAQQLPFGGIEGVSWDYQLLGQNDTEFSFLMAAIMNNYLEECLSVFNATGCRVHGVTSDAFSSYNWFKRQGLFDTQTATALVEMDDDKAEVVCQKNGQFAFTRLLNLKLPLELKQNSGSPVSLVGEYRKVLAEEINRSFQFFLVNPGGAEIKSVILSGACDELPQAMEYLQHTLKLQINWDASIVAFNRDGYNGDPIHPAQMSAVLGLALSCQQKVSIDINLLANTDCLGIKPST